MKPRKPPERSFGLLFAGVFTVVGLLPLWGSGSPRLWALAVAAGFAALALALPRVLAPVTRAWLAFGDLLHRLVSPVALGVIYFGTVVPTGLLMRLFGKDPLRLRFDPKARSYWIRREPPGPAPESLEKQF